MQKLPLKMKFIMFGFMILFMLIYMVLFGSKNAVIGIMVVMAAMMNIANDMSFKPKRSFVRVLALLLILGIASFLNSQISILGCIITFIVVFGTTFTSYNLFGTSVYLPYLMCYFMMMCIPVSLEELPMRLLGLVFGAAFIVGLNLLFNRKKEYKLTTETINNLICEINNAIDVKLDGGVVSRENFKTVNGFYLGLFSKFEYKYFPSPHHESVLNVVKSFQYIGAIISDYDLADDELLYIKNVLNDIENLNSSDILNGIEVKTKEMNLILLNLEIIVNEFENRDLSRESSLPDKKTIKRLLGPVLKRSFSFKSPKFTFAFKMAFVLTLWEVLTLIFNMPFTKWLYFASIPLMLPYVNDVAYTAKTRVIGTFIGAGIFTVIMIVMPYVPLPSFTFIMIMFVVCMFGMVYKMEDKLQMTTFTTVISIITALMYITPPQAIVLKILWVVVAVAVVSIFNFGFLPYSVEKESRYNLIASSRLNEQYLELIKSTCGGSEVKNKTTLLVLSNLIRENIEVTDENAELYQIQGKLNDICNFILTYMDIHEFSDETRDKIIGIIDNNEYFNDSNEIQDSIMLYSTRHAVGLFSSQNELINKLD